MTVQRQLQLQWAHQVNTKPIDWLWRPWLPRGAVVVIDGDPGAGKSSMMFDVVARISTGRAFPRIDVVSPEQPAPAANQSAGDQTAVAPITPQPVADDSAVVRPARRVIYDLARVIRDLP
jgi:hypothetical protein